MLFFSDREHKRSRWNPFSFVDRLTVSLIRLGLLSPLLFSEDSGFGQFSAGAVLKNHCFPRAIQSKTGSRTQILSELVLPVH